ncbi:MAG TPA: TonB-dependent receptor, partial [Caulobacter sp.]|nr:TonB-dependent receptor [Caulobacter sp.]
TARARQLYRAGETTSGKLATAPLESSLNIQVLNAELIRDQGARDAQDLYRNLAGVSLFSYAGVTARGFRQEEIFFDGLRGDPYVAFSVPQLFNVERLEFLKGPAGMLYGPGAPGGLFNYITKTPKDDFSARATAVVGTEARRGGSVEVEGFLPGDHAPATRLGVFYEDRNTPRRNSGSEVLILDGGIRTDLGPAALTLQATRYEQNLQGNRLRGVPTDNLGHFLADRRWNHNEKSDFLDLAANVLQARVEWPVTESLKIDAGLRYSDSLERQQYHEPRGLADSNRDGAPDLSRREFRDQERDLEQWSFGANAVWSRDLGGVRNRVLIGVDAYRSELVNNNRPSLLGGFTAVPGLSAPLSLTDPVYGVTDPKTYNLQPRVRTTAVQERSGAYLLEEATIGPVVATAGVRFDRYEDESGVSTFEDEKATWRAGLVWRVRPDVSLYGQWAQSYEPQSVSSQDPLAGGPFAPTQGEIVEGGVKTELLGGRLQSTLAVYRIVRSNMLQSDPRGDVDGDGVDDLVAFGEVTSKGVELDLAADLTRNWVLTGSYAYNDTRITRTNGATVITNSVGDRFANAPRHKAGFWTRYQFPELGLAVALGGDYVDVRTSISGQKVRPYAVFDASVIYKIGPWSTLLRVDNLLDETYAASGFIDRTGHFPGEPRSVFLEVSRAW